MQNLELPGLFDSAKQFLSTGLGLLNTRLELLTLELKQEKCRIVDLFFLLMTVVILGTFTLLLVTATILYVLWQSAPILALLGLCAVYGLATRGIYRKLEARLAEPGPLAHTISELKKDQACLQPRN